MHGRLDRIMNSNGLPKQSGAIWVLVISLCAAGCILPIPHKRTHAPAISGTVVSSETLKPMADVIILDAKFHVQTKTDANGHFSLPRIKRWHGAYLVSPITMSLFPSFDIAFPQREVCISYGRGQEMVVSVDSDTAQDKPFCVSIPEEN